MTVPSKTKTKERGRAKETELVITRVFDAPRELVWKAWTDPDQVARWWGPKGFTAPACKMDLRVGGEYLNYMRSPEGQDFWSKGVFREVVPFGGSCTVPADPIDIGRTDAHLADLIWHEAPLYTSDCSSQGRWHGRGRWRGQEENRRWPLEECC